MNPLLSKGRFVVCSTCNLLVDSEGNSIPNTHTDRSEQELLEMKYADCKDCLQLNKWRRLSISQPIILAPSEVRRVMAATV